MSDLGASGGGGLPGRRVDRALIPVVHLFRPNNRLSIVSLLKSPVPPLVCPVRQNQSPVGEAEEYSDQISGRLSTSIMLLGKVKNQLLTTGSGWIPVRLTVSQKKGLAQQKDSALADAESILGRASAV